MSTQTLQPQQGTATRFAIWYIKTYRARLAHRLPAGCRFVPSCSEYGLESYRRHSFLRATAKTVWRLLRCNPFRRGRGMYDPP